MVHCYLLQISGRSFFILKKSLPEMLRNPSHIMVPYDLFSFFFRAPGLIPEGVRSQRVSAERCHFPCRLDAAPLILIDAGEKGQNYLLIFINKEDKTG